MYTRFRGLIGLIIGDLQYTDFSDDEIKKYLIDADIEEYIREIDDLELNMDACYAAFMRETNPYDDSKAGLIELLETIRRLGLEVMSDEAKAR